MKLKTILATALILCASVLVVFQPVRADFYEDFGGTQIDLTNWTIVEYGSLNATLVGGKLTINGTYDPGETSPNTGGWNQYWMIYNQSFTGFVDISVSDAIVNMTAGEVAVGLGVIVDPGLLYDNVTTWVQYYFNGINAIGRYGSKVNMTATTLMLDNTDITIGEARHHRMIVYDNKSVQLLIDNVTKGWSNISGYSAYYPLISVGMKYAGTYLEAEFDDFLVLSDAIPDAVLDVTSSNLDIGELVGFDGSQSSYVVGSIGAYYFDFGDGSVSRWVEDSFTTHSYSAEGSYDARLKVRADNGKESDWTTVSICVDCSTPVAYLAVDRTEVPTVDIVLLDASGSSDQDGVIMGYYFDFGDGSTSGWIMSSEVSHSYTDNGTYQSRVKVVDDDGHESQWSAIVEIDVWNQLPMPILWASDTEVTVGEAVRFDGRYSYDLDGEVVEYRFDFGDGTSTSWTPYLMAWHEFDKAGTFVVSLDVRDDDGEDSGYDMEVTIIVREKEAPETLPWLVIIVLLLIILFLVIFIALQQRKLITQGKEDTEAPVQDEEEQRSE